MKVNKEYNNLESSSKTKGNNKLLDFERLSQYNVHALLLRSLFFLLFFCFSTSLCAQTLYEYKYWVIFEDKVGTPFSVDQPNAFLSERAIERRLRQNIPITNQDLPVSPSYIKNIEDLAYTVGETSRWFNALSITFSDTMEVPNADHPLLQTLLSLDFVKEVKLLSTLSTESGKTQENKFETEESLILSESLILGEESEAYFAESVDQILMLNGDVLHLNGYDGDGILIAVFDSGFSQMEEREAYHHIFNTDRFKGGFDLVEMDGDVFNNSSTHGGLVFSAMAGRIPGSYVGTAPNADYMLFITEATAYEQRIEEVNWVRAAEIADSSGADIITTSLAYADFFSPDVFDYSHEDLDGNTAIITRAADMAASKGILVVASAGNEGNDTWGFSAFPGDADSILSVGSVTIDEEYSAFSSFGPTTDGRVKPEVVAMGSGTSLINPRTGDILNSSGTSFSAPIIAGMAASLWESKPNTSAWDLRQVILESAAQYANPDDLLGYGLPNFQLAFEQLNERELYFGDETFWVYPNPFESILTVFYRANFTGELGIHIFDSGGRGLIQKKLSVLDNGFYTIPLNKSFAAFPSGIYFVQLTTPDGVEVLPVIRM